MRYIILQRTPFPGYLEPMPTCEIQQAEYALKLGRHYHERAQRIGRLTRELYLYQWEDAQQIVTWWRQKRTWAEYRVLGHVAEGATDANN